MPTTVASRNAMPEPSTVAASTQRPRAVPKASSSGAAAVAGSRASGPLPDCVTADSDA